MKILVDRPNTFQETQREEEDQKSGQTGSNAMESRTSTTGCYQDEAQIGKYVGIKT